LGDAESRGLRQRMTFAIAGMGLAILLAALLLVSGGCGLEKNSAELAGKPAASAVSTPDIANASIAPATAGSAAAAAAAEANWPDPARYEKEIAAFEQADRAAMPPAGAVLAIGSSSMRGWHKTISRDLAPLTIIPRGFGGSTMHDLEAYADRVIFPYKPRAILIYEGDNDIAAGVPPAAVLASFARLVERIHAQLPGTRVYVLSAKPSPLRWEHWPRTAELNAGLRAACEADPLLEFSDVATPMLGENGQPRPELFLGDRLHMNAQGYVLWTQIVRPALVEKEQAGENAGAGK